MSNTWLDRWKKELSQASRASLMFSIACTIVLLVLRYLGDHFSNWFALPLMLGYMISIPAIIVTTVLLGSTFPGWSDHAPSLFIIVVTVFNYLFYTAVIAAVRAYYFRADKSVN